MVYDMKNLHKEMKDDKGVNHDISFTLLPGKLVRAEGQPAVTDTTVNKVYDKTLQVLQFFREVFQYDSLNGQLMPVASSVHTSWNMLNASWLGVDDSEVPNIVYNQMAYGEGLPGLINGFENSLDVIGHEMTVRYHLASSLNIAETLLT